MSVRCVRPDYPEIVFDSILEARWSCVLDGLGLPWEREPVEFDLPSGRYTPDFRIFGGYDEVFWIEVKGPWPNAREFEVATEVNIYAETPLMILSGDIPRQANGGTAWWFDMDTLRWSMLRPEEALRRVMWREPGTRPDTLGGVWEQALGVARGAVFDRPAVREGS
jgi:hypothetical protein